MALQMEFHNRKCVIFVQCMFTIQNMGAQNLYLKENYENGFQPCKTLFLKQVIEDAHFMDVNVSQCAICENHEYNHVPNTFHLS